MNARRDDMYYGIIGSASFDVLLWRPLADY